MQTNWTSIFGHYTLKKDEIIFIGGKTEYEKSNAIASIASLICDESFGGGKISAVITFKDVNHPTTCEIIIYIDPETKYFVSVGLGGVIKCIL